MTGWMPNQVRRGDAENDVGRHREGAWGRGAPDGKWLGRAFAVGLIRSVASEGGLWQGSAPECQGPPSRPPADVVPRLTVRDPDAGLRVASWFVVAFACLQILTFSFGRDQGIYALVGEGPAHGQLPYRDLWDFKPPGIFFIYGLAQGLLGKSMLAPRLLEVAGTSSRWCSPFGRLAQTFFDNRTVGYVGGALAALIHAQLDFWHTGQPETLRRLPHGLRARRHDRGREPQAALPHLPGGGSAVRRGLPAQPPLGGGALVCARVPREARAARQGREGRHLARRARGAGRRAGRAPVRGVLRAEGGWSALSWTLFEFTPGYTSLGWEGQRAPQMLYHALEEAFFKFSALAAAGVIAAAAISPIHGREREELFLLLGIIALHVTGIAMQGKFFPYHYGATLPLIAFIAGLGLYKLWRRCLGGGAGGARGVRRLRRGLHRHARSGARPAARVLGAGGDPLALPRARRALRHARGDGSRARVRRRLQPRRRS